MGHNFGMSHDFDAKHGGDASPCNHQGIMSYGDKLNQWSTCSVNDFTGYYNSMKWGSTCMKGRYLSNSFKSLPFLLQYGNSIPNLIYRFILIFTRLRSKI